MSVRFYATGGNYANLKQAVFEAPAPTLSVTNRVLVTREALEHRPFTIDGVTFALNDLRDASAGMWRELLAARVDEIANEMSISDNRVELLEVAALAIAFVEELDRRVVAFQASDGGAL